MTERTIAPNVYGIETEYTCMLTFPGNEVFEIVGKCHSIDEPIGLYHSPEKKGSDNISSTSFNLAIDRLGLQRNSYGMLSNGARFYIDPSGPEYATPETTTAEEAVHRTFDGDDILLGILGQLREAEILEGFQVNRRTVDHNRKSRGIHLNTTTTLPAEEPEEQVKQSLATLNVVKGAIFGSGGLLLDENGKTAFHHSPRLSITDQLAANYYDYIQRPLVRYPFKPEGPDLARVETVTSDALNFAWPLRASLVMTNSLIRLLELGFEARIPRLKNPIDAAVDVGQYGHATQLTVWREKKGFVDDKPLSIIKELCELILITDESRDFLDKESRQVIPEIMEVSDRMSADEESVAGQVESVARKIAMRKKMERDKVNLDSEAMCRFDFAWDWIGGGGIAESLRNRNVAGWQGFKVKHSPSTSSKRRNVPPKDTRAKIRGDLIRESNGNVEIYDWTGTKHTYISPLDTKI